MNNASCHALAAVRTNFRLWRRAPLLCLWLFLLFAPPPALAVSPSRLITAEPSAGMAHGILLVHLSLTVDHEDGLRDMLKDGAVLELGINLSLERKRFWWADAQSADKKYLSVIMHDPLSRDFIVQMPGVDGEKELRDKNLTRLLHRSWRVLALPLATAEELGKEDPEAEFHINVTVSLRHINVPPWLEKSIIWSADVVPAISLGLPFSLPASVRPSP